MSYYFKRAGHCTRCGEPFGGNRATAYMVAETVAWRVVERAWGGPDGVALTQRETVPVCAACVTPAEEAAATQESVCKGCGQTMRSSFGARVCSNRCAQRDRRARQRQKRKHCVVCGVAFTSVRRDTRYCSAACKQISYRRRRQPAHPPAP